MSSTHASGVHHGDSGGNAGQGQYAGKARRCRCALAPAIQDGVRAAPGELGDRCGIGVTRRAPGRPRFGWHRPAPQFVAPASEALEPRATVGPSKQNPPSARQQVSRPSSTRPLSAHRTSPGTLHAWTGAHSEASVHGPPRAMPSKGPLWARTEGPTPAKRNAALAAIIRRVLRRGACRERRIVNRSKSIAFTERGIPLANRRGDRGASCTLPLPGVRIARLASPVRQRPPRRSRRVRITIGHHAMPRIPGPPSNRLSYAVAA